MATIPRQREYTPPPLPTDVYAQFADLAMGHYGWCLRYTADLYGPLFEGTHPSTGTEVRARHLTEFRALLRAADGQVTR